MLPRCCCCALAAALLLLLKLKRQEEQAGRRSGGKRAAAGELRDPSLGGVVDWWQESGSECVAAVVREEGVWMVD